MIERRTMRRLSYYADHPDEIQQRLEQLDEEWDIERVLATGSSTLTLSGILLSLSRSPRWLLLSLAVQGFFLQHALQGWCPPLPVFRRLGFRTQYEIESERYALKMLRGDFGNPATRPNGRVDEVVRAVAAR
jgi:hypothetical protein